MSKAADRAKRFTWEEGDIVILTGKKDKIAALKKQAKDNLKKAKQ